MRKRDGNPARTAWLVVAGLVVFMLALAGCGGGSDSTSGGSSDEALQKVGKGEGEVSLISWAGYVEPGWSKPFEQKTGCKVNNKEAGSRANPDESFPKLLVFTALWTSALAALCRGYGIKLVLIHQSTIFEKSNLNEYEKACGLGEVFHPSQEQHQDPVSSNGAAMYHRWAALTLVLALWFTTPKSASGQTDTPLAAAARSSARSISRDAACGDQRGRSKGGPCHDPSGSWLT